MGVSKEKPLLLIKHTEPSGYSWQKWSEKSMVNLNDADNIFLSRFGCGKSTIEVKISRKIYLLDIVKRGGGSADITLYRKLDKDRNKYSKHDPEASAHMVFVKGDAMIDREFLENIEAIEKAQNLCRRWSQVLA